MFIILNNLCSRKNNIRTLNHLHNNLVESCKPSADF